MSLLNRAIAGCRRLWRGSQFEEELDAELRQFLDAAVEARISAGQSPEDALRAARRELGNAAVVKERVRDVGWESLLDSVWQDVRYGARMLRRSPGFTATALVVLALGIGANTAIFTLIDAIMLRMLPVRDPHQLVELLSIYPGEPPQTGGFSATVYGHFRDHNHVFSDLVGVTQPSRIRASGQGLDEELIECVSVTGDFFQALGLQPALGRLLSPGDARLAGNEAVALVSWSFWKNRFNLDPAVVGARLTVGGAPVTVIGVVPRGFLSVQPGSHPDVWMPLPVDANGQIVIGARRAIGLIGRLNPGVSIEQARAEMQLLDRFRIDEIARSSRDPLIRQLKIDVAPAGGGVSTLRRPLGRSLLILMAMVSLVLLVACINVASLLLARASARQREMTLRLALGAGRLRLLRQVLTESLLLSITGSLIGVALAYAGVRALVRILESGRTPIGYAGPLDLSVQMDLRVLLFTAAIALGTGLLFGLAPAWNAFFNTPMLSLREIGAAPEPRSRRLFGKGLVVMQVAMSVVLLTAAGLFVRHLSNLRNLDLGFDRESALLVTLDPRGSGYDRQHLAVLYEALLPRLAAIPGVTSATISGATPIEGAGASRFVIIEGKDERPGERRYVSLNWVGPHYFETLGTPLVAGRDFQLEDAARPGVAIVNRAMARHYFGDADPIGRRFTFDGQSTSYEVVGVAADAKYLDLHEPPPRTVYLNALQDSRGSFHQFVLRTHVPPTAVAAEVRRVVRDALKTVALSKMTTLSDQVDASIVPERLVATLSELFGALGALLAAVGLYGLLSYSIARRVSEIGIRMALGATARDVMGMVLKGALLLVGIGLLIGVPLALWSRQLAGAMVVNLRVHVAWPIAAAALAMVAVGLVAAYVPARRASRVQPMDALRHS